MKSNVKHLACGLPCSVPVLVEQGKERFQNPVAGFWASTLSWTLPGLA